MSRHALLPAVFSGIILLIPAARLARAEEAEARDGLTLFSSKEGGFSIYLPGKPEHKSTTVGDAKETQHQFVLPAPQGAYIVSYQENPNLAGSTPEQLAAALESGRDRLLESFQGKLLENKSAVLAKKHPGLSFRLTIPKANGEARCQFFLVGTRLYQIMAFGVPEFVGSDETKRVMDSFKLLP
jgi:hypothetical protein